MFASHGSGLCLVSSMRLGGICISGGVVLEISTESNLAAVVDTKEQSGATVRQRRREAETGLKEGYVAAIGL